MTKKKSILTFVLAVCLIVPAIFMLTACGGNKNDPEDTKTEAVITLDNAYVLTKTYDGQTVENPTETQITKDSDGEMTIEWYAGEIKLEEGPKNAGNYKLVISTAETDTYKAGKLEKIYTINKKQLTISGTTVEDKEYDGNNTATVTAGTLAGLVGGDEGSVGVTATGTFASKDVAYEHAVDKQDVTISYALTGDLAKNYFAPVDEKKLATINPKPLVNVNLTKVYDGDGIFDRTALTTKQGIVAGESIEIYVNAIGANVGVYKDANFDFNEYVLYIGDSEEQTVNYAWGDSCTATITAKQLTVTANTVIKYYDGTTDFSQSLKTANVEGIVGSDDITVNMTGTLGNKNVTGAMQSCNVTFSLSGAKKDNYTLKNTTQVISVLVSKYNFNLDSKTGYASGKIYVTAKQVNNSGTVTFENVVVTGDIFEGDTITATIAKNGDSSKMGCTVYKTNETNISDTHYTITFGGADVGNYDFGGGTRYNPTVYLTIYEQEVKVNTETQCVAFASSTYWVKVDLKAVTGENGYSLVPKTEGTIATSGNNAPVMYDEEGNVVENMKPTKDGTYFIKFYANNANPYITVSSPKAQVKFM